MYNLYTFELLQHTAFYIFIYIADAVYGVGNIAKRLVLQCINGVS